MEIDTWRVWKFKKCKNIDILCDGKKLGEKKLTAGFEKEVITGQHWVPLLGVVPLRLGRANKLSAHLNREEKFTSAPFFNTFSSQPWLTTTVFGNKQASNWLFIKVLFLVCFSFHLFLMPTGFYARSKLVLAFFPKLPTNFKGQNR